MGWGGVGWGGVGWGGVGWGVGRGGDVASVHANRAAAYLKLRLLLWEEADFDCT